MFKKSIITLFILSTLFIVVGCQNNQEDNNNSNNNNNNTSNNNSSVEVTQENLSTFPVTDESMFRVESVEGGVSITGCSYEGDVIVVPEQINGQTVVGISDYAFGGMEMQGIVLPDTVTYIDSGAFEMCHELKYVDLGTGLKTIGTMAFNNCTSLRRVEFSEGMTTFYGVAFYNCDALTEIIVPASVTTLPKGIMDPTTCPNAVIVTPAGSAVEADCIEYDVPYRNY